MRKIIDKTKTKKLQLSTETIRQLGEQELLAVVGGVRKAGGETGSCGC